jgi:hypothetical protein
VLDGPELADVTERSSAPSARSAAASLADASAYNAGATMCAGAVMFAAASGMTSGSVAAGLFPPAR